MDLVAGASVRLFVVEQDFDAICHVRLLRSYIQTRDGEFKRAAFKVPVSGTVGCGDSYRGFIGGLAEGLDLEGACRLEAAVSAPGGDRPRLPALAFATESKFAPLWRQRNLFSDITIGNRTAGARSHSAR